MRAPEIVEGHPETDAGPGLAAVGVGHQMHFFVLDRAPQAFDEDVVHETAASVHRNRDSGSFELAGEGGAGELRALVGVENLRLSVALQGLLQRVEAETRIIVFDSRQASTARLAQSMIATR
jgi:hypothetical protein